MTVDLVLKGGLVVFEQDEVQVDLAIDRGKIITIGDPSGMPPARQLLDLSGLIILPGLVDPHCHFREPNPLAEEDFGTGTRAAAAGGVTTILEQPVDTPPTTTPERFAEKLTLVQPKSYVDFGLWGGVVPDNLDCIQPLAKVGACAFKAFICSSDPVYPMIDDGRLLEAMRRIAQVGGILAIHCENQAIIEFYQARLAAAEVVTPLDHARSRPLIAEVEAIQRMILLARETGVRLHILHVSSAAGVEVVTAARRQGQAVTLESCPHYLVLTEEALNEAGPYAKCNPPLRNEANVSALWQLLRAGQIDCIVSDHSPYTSEDKAKGLADIRLAPPGINGLEVGLPLMLSEGVNKGRLTLVELARYMSTNPAKLFGLYPRKGRLGIGADADLVIVDPVQTWTVEAAGLQTKNKWSPFDGWQLQGKVIRTILRGQTVYHEGEFSAGPGYGLYLPGQLGNSSRNDI